MSDPTKSASHKNSSLRNEPQSLKSKSSRILAESGPAKEEPMMIVQERSHDHSVIEKESGPSASFGPAPAIEPKMLITDDSKTIELPLPMNTSNNFYPSPMYQKNIPLLKHSTPQKRRSNGSLMSLSKLKNQPNAVVDYEGGHSSKYPEVIPYYIVKD